MDIGGWLRSLGLGQYEATFRESEIDADILPELTDQDLEKLGVPLGHRKRLLKAIGNLGSADHAAAANSWACPTKYRTRRRTPPSHGDVLRPCGLNGALCPHGP